MSVTSYTGRELRYRILARSDPEAAERLASLAQQQVNQRWATYEEMAARGPERFPGSGDGIVAAGSTKDDATSTETTGSDDEP
jgi:pyruvate-ferredoxin/flavodoxin oxidoreductase